MISLLQCCTVHVCLSFENQGQRWVKKIQVCLPDMSKYILLNKQGVTCLHNDRDCQSNI